MDRANNRKNKLLVIISTLLIMYVITGLALLALALLAYWLYTLGLFPL